MLREFFFVLIFHFNIFACFQANLRASIVARMHPSAPSSWPRSRWETQQKCSTTSKTNMRSDIWVCLFVWLTDCFYSYFISLLDHWKAAMYLKSEYKNLFFFVKFQFRLSGDSGCEWKEQEIHLHKINDKWANGALNEMNFKSVCPTRVKIVWRIYL